jgi:hypothetical protein
MTVDNTAPIVEALTPTPQVDTAVVSQDSDAEMGAIFDRLQAEDAPQERNADGKFAGAAKPEGDKVSLEGEKGAETAEAGSTVAANVSAPAHLPQAIKADWDKIPEGARSAIVAHQTEMDRKFSEVGRQLAQVKPVADRLTQAVAEFPEFAGRTPDQLAQGAVELAAVQARLERSPETAIETILEIAKHYGVHDGLAQRLGGQVIQGSNTEALQHQIRQLQGQLAQNQISPESIQQQVSEVLKTREVETEVNAFMTSKPYFADVENDMPYFITKAKAANPNATAKEALEAAYDMATNANPTVRQKIRDDEAAKVTTLSVDTKRVDQAKRAASINIKPAVNGRTREMTEDELMSVKFDQLMAS